MKVIRQAVIRFIAVNPRGRQDKIFLYFLSLIEEKYLRETGMKRRMSVGTVDLCCLVVVVVVVGILTMK